MPTASPMAASAHSSAAVVNPMILSFAWRIMPAPKKANARRKKATSAERQAEAKFESVTAPPLEAVPLRLQYVLQKWDLVSFPIFNESGEKLKT